MFVGCKFTIHRRVEHPKGRFYGHTSKKTLLMARFISRLNTRPIPKPNPNPRVKPQLNLYEADKQAFKLFWPITDLPYMGIQIGHIDIP